MYIDDNSDRKPLGAGIISSLEKAKAGLTSDGDFIEEYYTDEELDREIYDVIIKVINYLKLILFKWRRKSNNIVGEIDLLPIESVIVDVKDELIKYTFLNFISDVLGEEIIESSFRTSTDILLSIASAILYSKKRGNTIVIPDKHVDSYVKYYIENYYIRYNKPYLIDRIESLKKFIDSSKKILCDGLREP